MPAIQQQTLNLQPNISQIALNDSQRSLLRECIEQGLPICAKPYQAIAKLIGANEAQVIAQIAQWQQQGLIKRFGLVVKHRQLGYTANAMVVWDIKDSQVAQIAGLLAKRNEISLCYQRPRRLPDWPYNLFCMIHGKSRAVVEAQIAHITAQLKLEHINKDVLFSYQAFKQNGARYQQHKKQHSKLLSKQQPINALGNQQP